MMMIGGTPVWVETDGEREVRIRWGETDSAAAGLAEALGAAVSLAVRQGVPPEHLIEKFLNLRFLPQGETDDPAVPSTTSVADYLARRLADAWLTPQQRGKLGLPEADTDTDGSWPDAYRSP
ncbi:hypothetical protein [Actinocorallia sp. A-T 12471]|uniref:TSCPD domain-containing protein n=1 Tax=Actinocorallia sp. A-T 12471 TaxID=3089813 RepID=UPI0029D27A81|nr:hypothetical protein [Actinocorallia sp. A-T 12471]MDX6741837.1 hypothetical protein [Actinocorallia sp. A-T 12471]